MPTRFSATSEATMEFRIFSRRTLDIGSWDRLVAGGTFFHTHQWSDICSEGLGHRAHSIFLAGFEDGRMVAGMPAIITKKLGLRSFYSMPFGTYGEVVLQNSDDELARDVFNANLIAYLKNNRFSRIAITDFDGKFARISEPFLSWSPAFTHIISLNGDSSHNPPDKKINGHIRAGLRADTDKVIVKRMDHLDAFYDLYLLTEKRHDQLTPLYSRRFFKAILDVLNGSRMLYWNALLEGNEMIGSCINFIYGDTLFNWQTVSDYSKRHLKPNHVLLSDAIEHGIDMGVKKINLGASPPYAHSLIDYKERWGGIRVDYDNYLSDSWLRKLLNR